MAIVTALLYWQMVRRGPSLPLALAFAAAGTGLVLSNLSGVFLLLAMGLTVVTLHRPDTGRGWGWWFLAFGLLLALVSPWLLKATGIWAVDRIVPGAGTGEALRGETTFSLLALPYTILTFFYGYSLGPSLRELHQPDRMAVIMGYWPVLAAGGVTVGGALLAGFTKWDRRRLALLIWVLVPVAFAVVLAMRNIKPWNPRYVAVAMPWLVLMVGAGLARFPRRSGFVATTVLVGLTLWSLAGYYGQDKYAKADLKQAAAFVARSDLRSRVILVPVVTSVYGYYDRGAHQLLDSFGHQPLSDHLIARQFVAEMLGGHDFCRVVLAREWYFDPDGYLLPALAQVGVLRLEVLLPGVSVYTWERKRLPGMENDS